MAALLLVLTACGTAEPVLPDEPASPTVTPVTAAPLTTASPEPSVSQPVVSPEPEVTEPVETPEPSPSPEPETTEPVPSPELEATEPSISPEPEVSEPVVSPEPEVSTPAEEPTFDPSTFSATRAGLYELDTLTPIYEMAAERRMATASMGKIVTALTALRYVSPDTVFTVGTEQALVSPYASRCFIAQGQQLTLHQLLMGMLLPSGCDAAYTIAVNVARMAANDPDMGDEAAVSYFCGLMNDLAAELGAVNSHFANPDGWDNKEQYTTVQDLAIFVANAMESETIREIVSTREQWVVFVSGENITWRNTNALLNPESKYYCPNAVGMKTGTTTAAGNCLAAVVEQNGSLYISIIVGCPTEAGRYEDTFKLLNMIPQAEAETETETEIENESESETPEP